MPFKNIINGELIVTTVRLKTCTSDTVRDILIEIQDGLKVLKETKNPLVFLIIGSIVLWNELQLLIIDTCKRIFDRG